MRRPLAITAAVIALSAAPVGAREPLDFDLTRLGPPTAQVWLARLGCGAGCTAQQQADAAQMAGDARVRFARLATDLALGLTTTLAQPASTTGHSGFQFDLEGAYTGVSHSAIGGSTASFDVATYGGARDYWPSRSQRPGELLVPSFHVRKGLPFSFEVGGRLSYLAQSSYFATQLEGKWAIVEGYTYLPEVAVRVAWSRLLGQRELDLGATELGLLTSKRFGVNAVTSLTPYLGFRYTRVSASTKTLTFAPVTVPATPTEAADTYAAFPDVKAGLYRTTAGVRLTSFAVAMAAELTWYGGGSFGEETPAATDYPSYYVPSAFSGAFKFGFEF
ncbi:MAG: hypothetical protein NDI82_00820 [Anaeromyxobacteraceae bacterium]|nr:hypothetical protein [Anaeromyxobacteraceae bacterium]